MYVNTVKMVIDLSKCLQRKEQEEGRSGEKRERELSVVNTRAMFKR
jgi:hypothetical protein